MHVGIFLAVTLATLSNVHVAAFGSVEGDTIVPRNDAWLKEVDISSVPGLPVRPVGSGTCKNAKCDGSDNDKCFESCGNKATPSDIYGCPRPLQWALTFDDGPSEYTGELLDHLDSLGIKATFCVMGANVKKYPHFLKRAYEGGHLIASHTYSHPHLMSLTNEQIINEVKATEEAIRDVIGVRPSYIRPPYGEADDRVKALMKAMDYKLLLWNVDPTDYDVYSQPDAGDIIKAAFKKAANGVDTGLNSHNEPGYISLQHDLYKQSIQQVPEIVNFLKAKGYSFVTAAECINDSNPHRSNSSTIATSTIASSAASLSSSSQAATSTTHAINNKDAPMQSMASTSQSNSIWVFLLLCWMSVLFTMI
ncbi:hypothetical protein BC940DRAFT_366788 [Gongronella butleri]|nr:hypothetical protein BC940DRAFT_366788 [Gongronella butleri]